MIRRLAGLLLIGLACLAAAAPVRATRPAVTRPAAAEADAFLDRARQDIVELLKLPPKAGIPSLVDLTQLLNETRGNDGDRALAREVLRRLPELTVPGKVQDFRPVALALSEASLLWALGERDAARQSLGRAQWAARWTKPPDDPLLALGARMMTGTIAELRTEWDGFDALAQKAERDPDAAFGIYLSHGRVGIGTGDVARGSLRRAVELVTSGQARPTQKELLDLTRALAEAGDFATALAVAERLDEEGWERTEALITICWRAEEAGRPREAHPAAAAALRSAQRRPRASDSLAHVARCAADIDDAETFAAAAAAAEKAWADDARTQVSYAPAFARAHLRLRGDRAAFDRLTKLAEAAAARLERGSREHAELTLDLAACHAAAGRHEVAERLIASTDRAGLAVSETFWRVIDTYRRAGDYDRAVAMIEKHLDGEDRDRLYVSTLQHAALAGRFDVALNLAGRPTRPWFRTRARRFNAREQARAGRLADVEPWVSKLDAPAERAAVRLGVAALLLERPRDWSARLFQDRL